MSNCQFMKTTEETGLCKMIPQRWNQQNAYNEKLSRENILFIQKQQQTTKI